MEIKITNILKQFGFCNISFIVTDDTDEVKYQVEKVFNDDETLSKRIEEEKLNLITEYFNQIKMPEPNYIVIDVEYYNGISKLACYVSFYDMLTKVCKLSYELRSEHNVIEKGDWMVDENTLTNWGYDDNILIDSLCNYLNLVRI